jgi:FkbM family methyltransferase
VSAASQLRFLRTHIQVRSFLLGFWDWFRATAFNQRAEVKQPILGSPLPISLRIGTSDLDVYKKIFLDREYEVPFHAQPKTILDLGANTGLASLFFSLHFPNAQIVAVEPDPANFALLKKNTAHLPQVTCLQAAVWPHDAQVRLVDPGIGAWGLQIHEDPTTNSPSIPVLAISLPSLLRDFPTGQIDLLKIDIEGAEKELLENADSWIPSVNAIVIELHDRYKPGCSRAFYRATNEFPNEKHVGENIWIWRNP